jgi:FkbM family methyltransferase
MSTNVYSQERFTKFDDILHLLSRIYRLSLRQHRVQAHQTAILDIRDSPLMFIYHLFLRKFFGLVIKIFRRMKEVPLCVEYLGNDFWLPSRSGVGWQIAYGAEWDSQMRVVLPHVLTEPRVCIEVGSNIGASTVLIQNLFPEAALVLAEPAQRFRRYLVKNLKANPNVVHIEDRIIASKTGLTATIQTNWTTGSASNANYGADLTSRESLMTVALDDLVKELGLLGRIDFIKVDTDGYEYEVFSGARQTVVNDKPLIFTEFSPPSLRRVLNSDKEFIDLLASMGCEIFLVFHPNGTFKGIARDYEQIMSLKGDVYYVDLFTLPRGSRHEDAFWQLGQMLSKNKLN